VRVSAAKGRRAPARPRAAAPAASAALPPAPREQAPGRTRPRRRRTASVAAALALLLARSSEAALFVVNSSADADDGRCDIDSGCTLREAINAANATPGRDQIIFLVRPLDGRVKTIQPRAPLPLLSDPDGTVLNGLTQPGSQANARSDGASDARLLVEINGALAGAPVNGIVVTGGPTSIAGLVINGFAGSGILLAGGRGHVVAGNFIGTDASGQGAMANLADGVTVLVPDCRVGLGTEGRNILSGNGQEGVQITGESSGVSVEGNLIGLAADGLPRLGNGRAGVSVWTPFNRIGGLATGSGNYIGGNVDAGVVLVTSGAHDNVVQSSSIFANRSHGVLITVDAWNNRVARTGGFPLPSNSIVGNGGNGVCVTATAGSPNTALPFEVARNDLVGLDYTGGEEDEWGVTPNDPLDADEGPNGLQNSPELLEAVQDELGTSVRGVISGEPHEDLVVSFYVTDACHPSGRGDGRIVAGDFVTRTDENGLSEGRARLAAKLGDFVSAVSMDLEGNTSEASACVRVVAAPTAAATETADPAAATPTEEAVLSPTDTPTETPALEATATPAETPTREPTTTVTPAPIAGDASCDHVLAAADLTAAVRQMAAATARCGADVDGDGRVALDDLQAIVSLLFSWKEPHG
jgi:CSLREA domain-containing protein